MKELHDKTLKDYIRIFLACICAVLIAELFFGIFRYATGDFNISQFGNYIWFKALLPSGLNFGVFFVARGFLESPNVKLETKVYMTFGSLCAMCLVTTVAHRDFPSLCAAFILPVVTSAIYGQKKFIRFAFELAIFGITIAFALGIVLGKGDDFDIVTYVIQIYISVMLLVISLFIAMLIRRFVENNSVLIMEGLENQASLKDRVKVDAMTGLINHTAFYDELDRQIRESDRTGETLCISVVDIDNFKSVNDTYGHANGDQVIITLAQIMSDVCKGHIVCRYGGEEFSVIFKNCKRKEAAALMEQVLERFRATEFEWCDHAITFSCGVCQHYDIRTTAEELFMQADKYLYRAKRGGKNQVVSEG